MSRNAVRLAIAEFLAEATIPGLQKVYKAMAWLTPGELIKLAPDGGSAAVAWVQLETSDEDRWSVPASYPGQPGGIKVLHYEVRLMVYFVYLVPSATTDTTTSPDDWVDAEDAILQGIKDRIHSDPQLGTGPTGTNTGGIFTAAQEPGALKITSDQPMLEPGSVICWHAIDFRVSEVIQA